MTGSPAYRVTLLYPDERRVILTVLGVQASMAGGVSARRSSIVMQRRQGTQRETLCTILFDDFYELAGIEAALGSLRAVVCGDLQRAVALADEAAQQHMGWQALRSLIDRVPGEPCDPPGALPQDAEELGNYPSVAAYLQAQLEGYVHPAGLWILDYLDMPRVRARFEAGGRFRYFLRASRVYRTGR